MGGYKIAKFMKVFSLKSFLLYSIRLHYSYDRPALANSHEEDSRLLLLVSVALIN